MIASKACGPGLGKCIVGSCVLCIDWICGIHNYGFFNIYFFKEFNEEA